MPRNQAGYMAKVPRSGEILKSDVNVSVQDAEESPEARLLGAEEESVGKVESGLKTGGRWRYRKTSLYVTIEAYTPSLASKAQLGKREQDGAINRLHLRAISRAIRNGALELESAPQQPPPESATMKGILLVVATVGLLGSYLTWGFIQETVKNKRYGKTGDFEGEKFPSDVFLVFGNRLLAVVVAAAMVMLPLRKEPPGGWAPQAPMLSFAPCSLSNVMSSYAQYHSLDYISFPLQVVSKSCKVVPVMLVGMFVHGKSYPLVEYLEAVAIALGVSMFSLSQSDGPKDDQTTQGIGMFFVVMYLVCDSFTSQWQDRIFKRHKIDQYQMMFGVNCFSILFTSCSLLVYGGFSASFTFLATYPEALWHVLTLSVTSATGQLFIFYTIKKFGPIIFTIIMTTRQMVSLVVSAIVFVHPLGLGCWGGAVVVFGTIGYRIRRKMLARG